MSQMGVTLSILMTVSIIGVVVGLAESGYQSKTAGVFAAAAIVFGIALYFV